MEKFVQRVPYGEKLFSKFPKFKKVGVGVKHKRIGAIENLVDLLELMF